MKPTQEAATIAQATLLQALRALEASAERGFARQGAMNICMFCGAAEEGTAAFAIAHHRDCVAKREATE